MFIIGAKAFEKNLGKSKIIIHCEHCKREAFWNYVHVRPWVTIYFLPFIPLPRYNEFRCPICDFKITETKKNSDVFHDTNSYYAIDSRSLTSHRQKKDTHSPIPDDTPTNPLRLLLAFIFSTIAFCLSSLCYIFTFDIKHDMKMQDLEIEAVCCAIPCIMMLLIFFMINKNVRKVEMIFLFLWNCILVYFMFQIAMCCAVMRLNQGITFPRAWELVKQMKRVHEIKVLFDSPYYKAFLPMYLTNIIVCIIFAVNRRKDRDDR